MNQGDFNPAERARQMQAASMHKPTVAKKFRNIEEIEESLAKLDPIVVMTIRRFVSALLAEPTLVEIRNQERLGTVMDAIAARTLSEYKYGRRPEEPISKMLSQADLMFFWAEHEMEIRRVTEQIVIFCRKKK